MNRNFIFHKSINPHRHFLSELIGTVLILLLATLLVAVAVVGAMMIFETQVVLATGKTDAAGFRRAEFIQHLDELRASDAFAFYPGPAPKPYTEDDVEILAKTVWGEARGCEPDEWALVVWTVLQRVGDPRWPDSIANVATQRGQFTGYNRGHPIDDEIYAVCLEEVEKWANGAKAPTHETYAPTAPYYFFEGREGSNWFREFWK